MQMVLFNLVFHMEGFKWPECEFLKKLEVVALHERLVGNIVKKEAKILMMTIAYSSICY
jgi:hypothetical protein